MDVSGTELPEATNVEAQSQPDNSNEESPQNDDVSSNSQHIPDDQPRRDLGFPAKLWAWLPFYRASRDQVEHDYWSMIREGAPDQTRGFLEYLENYCHIKDCPGRAIFDHILWYTEYQSYVEEHRFYSEFRAGHLTFSRALDRLGEQLRSVPTRPTMKLCVLSTNLPNHIRSGMYSFDTKVFATPKQLKRMYQVPINAILHVIRKEWGSHHPCLTTPGPVTKSIFPLLERQSGLPSKVHQQKLFSIAKPGEMAFTWVAKAPKYQNDFYEYIWQRQTEYPEYEKAIVSACRNARGSINVIVIFDSTSETEFGRESTRLLEEYYHQRKDSLRLSLDAVDNPPSVETEFIASIYAIYTCLSAGTVSFLNAVSDQLSHLTFLGRRKPSGAKLHYLSHLDDFRRISALGIDEALSNLSQIENAIEDNNSMVDQRLLEKSETIKADLVYLSAELANLKDRIEELRKMVRDKLEISQISRTYILTILAAIYLPFSFMTSLFGMNLIDPLWRTTDGQNSSPNDVFTSRNESSPFTQNQTASIVNAITGSGTHLWSFKSYWYITIPLTIATIFVPLVAGAIFRAVSRLLYRNRTSWRRLGTSFAIVLTVIFCVVIRFRGHFRRQLFNILIGMGFGTPALILLVRAFLRKQDRPMWSVFLGLVILASIPFPPTWSAIFYVLAVAYLPAVLTFDRTFRAIYRTHRHNRVNRVEMSQGRTEGDAERGEVDGGMTRDPGDR